MPDAARLTWLGHGSCLLELDGARLVSDPLLRRRVAHLWRALPLVPLPDGELDAVLITHQHLDHLDLPSLVRIGRDRRVVAPSAAGALLRRHRFSNVTEVDEGDVVELGALRVLAVPADHDGRRLRFGASAAALGYVIEGSRRVYLPGDTDLFEGMAGLRPLDASAVPVWGWGPRSARAHGSGGGGAGRRAARTGHRRARALRHLRPRGLARPDSGAGGDLRPPGGRRPDRLPGGDPRAGRERRASSSRSR